MFIVESVSGKYVVKILIFRELLLLREANSVTGEFCLFGAVLAACGTKLEETVMCPTSRFMAVIIFGEMSVKFEYSGCQGRPSQFVSTNIANMFSKREILFFFHFSCWAIENKKKITLIVNDSTACKKGREIPFSRVKTVTSRYVSNQPLASSAISLFPFLS